jgi:Predicted N-acetylglucosaminyl transferase
MRPFNTNITITLLVLATLFVACGKTSQYDEAHAVYNKGVELREAKQNEDAAKCFTDALVKLNLCDEDNNNVKALKAAAENRLGEIYWLQGLFEEARDMHLVASTLFRELNDETQLMEALRNAARAEGSLKNLKDAEKHYNEAIEIAKTLKAKDFINEISLDLARDIYMETNDFGKVISVVNEALDNGAEPYQCHLLLGLANYYLENDDEALEHLNEAAKCDKAGFKMTAYQTIYFIYQLKGDYAKALEYHELFNENMIEADSQHRSDDMQHIKGEYDLKMQENVLNAKQRTRTLYLSGILGMLGIALIITIILLRQRTLKTRLEAEKAKNQFELALKKNKVYVTALALSEQITASTLDFNLKDTDWDDFTELINLIYNDFTKKLIERYPTLTASDIQICCLTRQGFSNQVISILMNQQTNSYARRKSRIKQEKMNGNEDSRSFEEIIEEI